MQAAAACVCVWAGDASPAKEAVAMVSSWSHLPWMIEVCPLRAWLSTAFHTLLQASRQAAAGGGGGRQAGEGR